MKLLTTHSLIFTFIFFLSFNSNSQSISKKISTFTINTSFKPSPLYGLSLGYTLYDEDPSLAPFVTLELDYKIKLSRKVAFGIIYTRSSHSLAPEDNGSIPKFALNEFGGSINYYLRGNFAPVGNYFSFFMKYSNASIEGIRGYKNNQFIDGDYTHNALAFGVSWNGMWFFTDNSPLYLNYGFGFAYRDYTSDHYFNEKKTDEFYNVAFQLAIRESVFANVGLGVWF